MKRVLLILPALLYLTILTGPSCTYQPETFGQTEKRLKLTTALIEDGDTLFVRFNYPVMSADAVDTAHYSLTTTGTGQTPVSVINVEPEIEEQSGQDSGQAFKINTPPLTGARYYALSVSRIRSSVDGVQPLGKQGITVLLEIPGSDKLPSSSFPVSPLESESLAAGHTFIWTPAEGALFYRLEFSTDPDFSDVAFSRELKTNTTEVTWAELEALAESRYYWRVKTQFYNSSVTSIPSTFLILTEPSAIYVDSRYGLDALYNGSRDYPAPGLKEGLELARQNGISTVLVSAGDYYHTPVLEDGMQIKGGYNSQDNWSRDSLLNTTTVNGISAPVVTLQGNTEPSHFSGFTVKDGDLSDQSVLVSGKGHLEDCTLFNGLRVDNSDNVQLIDLRLGELKVTSSTSVTLAGALFAEPDGGHIITTTVLQTDNSQIRVEGSRFKAGSGTSIVFNDSTVDMVNNIIAVKLHSTDNFFYLDNSPVNFTNNTLYQAGGLHVFTLTSSELRLTNNLVGLDTWIGGNPGPPVLRDMSGDLPASIENNIFINAGELSSLNIFDSYPGPGFETAYSWPDGTDKARGNTVFSGNLFPSRDNFDLAVDTGLFTVYEYLNDAGNTIFFGGKNTGDDVCGPTSGSNVGAGNRSCGSVTTDYNGNLRTIGIEAGVEVNNALCPGGTSPPCSGGALEAAPAGYSVGAVEFDTPASGTQVIPSVSFTTASATYNEAAGTVSVNLELNDALAADAQVTLARSGTADTADYYLFDGNTQTIPAGQTMLQIDILIVDDIYGETDETLTLAIDNFSDGVIGSQAQFTLTITDNENSTPPATVTGAAVTAGTNTVTLNYDAASDDDTPGSGIIYRVCHSAVSGGCDPFTASLHSAAGALSVTLPGLPGSSHYFRVAAVDRDGNESIPTAETGLVVDDITYTDGGSYDTGNLMITADGHTLWLTLANNTGSQLDLTGSPAVQLSGADAALFSVSTQPALTTLADGQSTRFALDYNPVTPGSHSVSIDISDNQAGSTSMSLAAAAHYGGIYITAANVTGDMNGLEGIKGGDALCAADANRPDNGRTYKAMLGASSDLYTRNTSNDWVFEPNTTYARAGTSTVIQTTNAGSTFDYPLNNSLSSSTFYFLTGLTGDFLISSYRCTEWSNGTASVYATYGASNSTSDQAVNFSYYYCNYATFKLTCVEQPP